VNLLTFDTFHDDICHTVPQSRSRTWQSSIYERAGGAFLTSISLLHTLGQLHMSLLRRVVFIPVSFGAAEEYVYNYRLLLTPWLSLVATDQFCSARDRRLFVSHSCPIVSAGLYSYWLGTHSSAPLTSRSINILKRQVSITVDTSRQLSLRTVCAVAVSVSEREVNYRQSSPQYLWYPSYRICRVLSNIVPHTFSY
jgi:hypothetical protein